MLTDLKGEPLLAGNEVHADGSPFYHPTWTVGTVKLVNNKELVGIPIKLNLHNDQVHYWLEETKSERVAGAGLVKEITFTDPQSGVPVTFRCGFPAIAPHDGRTFYQVLEEGEATLLRQVKQILIEEKPFNSATIHRRYDTQKGYFIWVDNRMNKIKRTKSGILDVLSNKRNALNDFLHTNVNLKSDADLSKVVAFYNSL